MLVNKFQNGWGRAGKNTYLYESFGSIKDKLSEMIRMVEEDL